MKSTSISPGVDGVVVTGVAAGVAVGATGCTGTGSYLDFAKEHEFEHIEVVDWSSSAGDWTFIVSKDGHEWRLSYQENNYPGPGFSHYLGDEFFFGSAEEVLTHIYEREYA